jgi:hypothetical protein
MLCGEPAICLRGVVSVFLILSMVQAWVGQKLLNRNTPIWVRAGTRNSPTIGFEQYEQYGSSVEHCHNPPHKHHHDGVPFPPPPYGVDSMNHPIPTRGRPSEGVD